MNPCLHFSHPEEAAIANKTEIGLTEVEEGEEPEVFWIALGGKEDYGSLLNGKLVRMRFHVNNRNKINILLLLTSSWCLGHRNNGYSQKK